MKQFISLNLEIKFPVSFLSSLSNNSLVRLFGGMDSESPKCLSAKVIMKKYSGALVPAALS